MDYWTPRTLPHLVKIWYLQLCFSLQPNALVNALSVSTCQWTIYSILYLLIYLTIYLHATLALSSHGHTLGHIVTQNCSDSEMPNYSIPHFIPRFLNFYISKMCIYSYSFITSESIILWLSSNVSLSFNPLFCSLRSPCNMNLKAHHSTGTIYNFTFSVNALLDTCIRKGKIFLRT